MTKPLKASPKISADGGKQTAVGVPKALMPVAVGVPKALMPVGSAPATSSTPAGAAFEAASTMRGSGAQMEILAVGSEAMLCRPCVDCGVKTGRYCDFCLAADRIPSEEWAEGQLTPLCSRCDNTHDKCHFCRKLAWCMPFPTRSYVPEE